MELKPKVVISNGPGTAVPVLYSVIILRLLGLANCKIIFVESFCRTNDLSLSGRLVYPFADTFVVHWEKLVAK